MSVHDMSDMAARIARLQAAEASGGGGQPPGDDELKERIAKLETHFEYFKAGLDEVKTDVKEVHDDMVVLKRRAAYVAGAVAVVGVLLAWMLNNRFEQVLELLNK